MAWNKLGVGSQSCIQIQTAPLTSYDLDSSRSLSPHKEKRFRPLGVWEGLNEIILSSPLPSSLPPLPSCTSPLLAWVTADH